MQKLKWKYVFLTLSLAGFAVAFADRSPTLFSYMSLPIAAILFELFLVASFLQNESALYDEQNRAAELVGGRFSARLRKISRPVRAGTPTLTAALTH